MEELNTIYFNDGDGARKIEILSIFDLKGIKYKFSIMAGYSFDGISK